MPSRRAPRTAPASAPQPEPEQPPTCHHCQGIEAGARHAWLLFLLVAIYTTATVAVIAYWMYQVGSAVDQMQWRRLGQLERKFGGEIGLS